MADLVKSNFANDNSGNIISTVIHETIHGKIKIDNERRLRGKGIIRPTHHRIESGLVEQGFFFNYNISSGVFNEIFIDGVHIFFNDITSDKELVINAEMTSPFMEMFFMLEGSNSITDSQGKSPFNMGKNQNNLFFISDFIGKYHLEGKRFQSFGIQMSEKFFNRLADANSKALKYIFEGIEKKKEYTQLTMSNLQNTPAIKSIIYEMINNNRRGYMKRLFLESKIIELFMLQVEQAENANNVRVTKFKKEDIDRIYDAKSFIERNMLKEFTLMELSHTVGLNDFKLKKGFKELFGTTVFSYLNELKMDYAKRLILDEKKPIYETAMILSYSEPHHFSTAFKRRFGYSPGELK